MPTPAANQNTTAKILIADDKEQMRDVLRKFLAAEGYAVETAADGADTLRKFSENSFDLVLSDIKMPAMDGVELLAEILKINPNAIVILMTAFGSIEAAVEAIKRGAASSNRISARGRQIIPHRCRYSEAFRRAKHTTIVQSLPRFFRSKRLARIQQGGIF